MNTESSLTENNPADNDNQPSNDDLAQFLRNIADQLSQNHVGIAQLENIRDFCVSYEIQSRLSENDMMNSQTDAEMLLRTMMMGLLIYNLSRRMNSRSSG